MPQQPCPTLVAVVVLLLPLVGVRMMTKTSVRGLADASRWLMQCASHRRRDVHSTVKQIPISMRRTSNIEEFIDDDEQKPDFDDMMSEVQEEIEEHDAEDAVVSRAPELRQLSENIEWHACL